MSQDPTGSKRMTESPSDIEMSDVDNNKERTPSTSTNLPNPPSRVEPAATGSTNPILIRDDVDLKHADLDARIKRCEERIAIGYAKEAFKRKLENLKAEKQRRLDLLARYPGKSWDVVQRLEKLKNIATYLESKSDPCCELLNVNAIIAAYENNVLQWDGNATYWCQGQMISGPSQFSWQDFYTFNTKENRGGGGFWVEGANELMNHCNGKIFGHDNSARPFTSKSTSAGPGGADSYCQNIDLVIRLDRSVQLNTQGRAQAAQAYQPIAPGAVPTMTFGSNMPGTAVPTGPGSPSHDRDGVEFPQLELPFLDDTGASTMVISDDDMLLLMGGDAAYTNAPMDHLMGYDSLRIADGSSVVIKTIAVQVNMYGTNEYNYQGLMVSDWTTIPCSVIDNTGGNQVERLNGPWFRSMLYVGSAPKFPPTVYSGPNKRSIMARDMIPVVDASRTGPHFSIPIHGTEWVPVPGTFMSIAYKNPNISGRVP